MSRRSPARRRGRRTPGAPVNPLLADLGLSDVSWPVIGWTIAILTLGFGPLLIATLTGAAGIGRRFLVALGPALICLAFAGLTWKYGMSYAREMGQSKRRVYLLVALFVTLAGLAGWALFVSV
jgi:hypothetical protein